MISRRSVLKVSCLLFPVLTVRAEAAERRTGTFGGASGHTAAGTATVVLDGRDSLVELGADFKFDGAPDPKVALGYNGYDPQAIVAPLAKNAGRQTYRVPARLDAEKFNQVWIWCEEYNVPLGLAELN